MMERSEMIDALSMLYDRRLKALLCYQATSFTHGLVAYMFQRFDEITESGQPMFGLVIQSYIADVLQYGTSAGNQSGALLALNELTSNLENYIKCTILCFWPEKRQELDAYHDGGKPFDCRSFIGGRFKEIVEKYPGRFPEKLSHPNIVSQLRHVTEIRNRQSHPMRLGYTALFDRYQYLKAFDVLLGYLLYTYYHLIFAGIDLQMNYLNKQMI